MMLLDGCFILQYLHCIVTGNMKELKIKSHDIPLIRRDLFLLENQLPFEVLHVLMSCGCPKKAFECKASSLETVFADMGIRDTSSGNWFHANMARDSRSFMNVLIGNEFKDVFKGLTSLVDVGGGTGTVAMAITKKFPDIKCIVLDLPPVVANLQGSENLEFVAGDMFQKIPAANAVLLKSILHDWNDEECVKILKNCKDAITRSGKVIIIDMVMENPELDDESFQAQLFIDMLMMVFLGSKERNKKEWEKFFFDAGFTSYKIILTLGLRSVIELYP
ncbi:Trans-resveratrol di-O-methyltransferase [Capsicum baccatum]|uniref:Trans-resveratrol di-O-methyltransferase n=1 Tax=Capsicum baccatum TaxID=33114 RepID=A0A2G2VW91_CAPBA|nr:Trans-resveratrol di-O-methyltransferase [Capsicum baccatum]